MSREITHDADGPKILGEDELEEQGGNIALCMCGLSANYPYCDGSHGAVADEEAETRYKYEDDDDENPRHAIAELVFEDD